VTLAVSADPSDGLHLSPAGYQVLFDEVIAVIQASLPELINETLPMRLP